jgi:hypothetical protein
MGIVDKAKDALAGAKGKAAGLAEEHGDKVTAAVDKATGFVDEKTKHKFTPHLEKVHDVTASAISKVAGKDGKDGKDGADLPPPPEVGDPGAATGTP